MSLEISGKINKHKTNKHVDTETSKQTEHKPKTCENKNTHKQRHAQTPKETL